MVAKRLVGEDVEFTRIYVSLDLAIPCSRSKFSEPLPKLGKFLSRETGALLLELPVYS
jgi:hypothetical protein